MPPLNVGQDGMSEVRWQDVFVIVVDDEGDGDGDGGEQAVARQSMTTTQLSVEVL
jgi:hypothetical protein